MMVVSLHIGVMRPSRESRLHGEEVNKSMQIAKETSAGHVIQLPARLQSSSFSIGKTYRLFPERTGSPKFLPRLSLHAMFSDPDRPSGISPLVIPLY